MATLNNEMKEMFEKKKFAIVGTASKVGIPNAVAMGSPMVLDDENLCFACVTDGKTFNNVHENPNVAITIVDAETFQQHQIKGKASVETDGPLFEKFKELMAPFNVVPKCAVKVSVDEIFSLR